MRVPAVNSLHTFTDEEQMLRESGECMVLIAVLLLIAVLSKSRLLFPTVQRLAQDVIAPKVREMDEQELMDPAIIKALFEQGVSNLNSVSSDHIEPFPNNSSWPSRRAQTMVVQNRLSLLRSSPLRN